MRAARVMPALALATALAVAGCAGVGGQASLYDDLAEEDVEVAAHALQHALETAQDGESRRWSNTGTGHSGRVTLVRTVLTEAGRFCREYEEELNVGGRSASYTQRACRDPRGRWVWL